MIFPLYTTTSLPSEGGFCTSRIQSHVGDIDRSRRREEEEEGGGGGGGLGLLLSDSFSHGPHGRITVHEDRG